ncbi:MAG: hypothetical protein VX475_06675, partial [Myxococcota bacterium]|nr:hypothetical protein [Myxococcota bacterium]
AADQKQPAVSAGEVNFGTIPFAGQVKTGIPRGRPQPAPESQPLPPVSDGGVAPSGESANRINRDQKLRRDLSKQKPKAMKLKTNAGYRLGGKRSEPEPVVKRRRITGAIGRASDKKNVTDREKMKDLRNKALGVGGERRRRARPPRARSVPKVREKRRRLNDDPFGLQTSKRFHPKGRHKTGESGPGLLHPDHFFGKGVFIDRTVVNDYYKDIMALAKSRSKKQRAIEKRHEIAKRALMDAHKGDEAYFEKLLREKYSSRESQTSFRDSEGNLDMAQFVQHHREQSRRDVERINRELERFHQRAHGGKKKGSPKSRVERAVREAGLEVSRLKTVINTIKSDPLMKDLTTRTFQSYVHAKNIRERGEDLLKSGKTEQGKGYLALAKKLFAAFHRNVDAHAASESMRRVGETKRSKVEIHSFNPRGKNRRQIRAAITDQILHMEDKSSSLREQIDSAGRMTLAHAVRASPRRSWTAYR